MWGFKAKRYRDSCTCLPPGSFQLWTLYMKTLRRVLCVCVWVCVSELSVVWTSESVLLSSPSPSSHWKLSLDLLPTATPPFAPSLHFTPPSSPSSLLPILVCVKGLDCSQPEQRRVTPELPFKCWVGHGRVGRNGGRGWFKKPWKSSHTCLPDSKN